MKKTSLTITVLAGLLLAFAIIMGLRSCGHPDDIFAPGERVVDKVDWGQYDPGLFAGKVYTYARLQGKGDDKEATIIIIVPYPKDMNVSKDGLSSSGRDYIVKLKLESAMGRPAGVFELTLGGIPAKEFDRIKENATIDNFLAGTITQPKSKGKGKDGELGDIPEMADPPMRKGRK